ncbi:MAG TPA: PEGA domain-containing protein [Kofleriaceae bacterium]|nr:PEGA domain-containing protein [Kofleriaceae bacterium]
MLSRLAACAVLLASTSALADRVVAVAPLSTLGAEDRSASTRQLTAQIEAALATLPGTRVIGAAAVSDAIKKAKKPQLKVCERDIACLAELGRLVGAAVVIDGEVGGLGDSKVVYLGATDVTTGKELRSTTLSVGSKTDDTGGAPGAAVRLLEPERYRGTVRFAIDVGGAVVYVNGSRAALKNNELSLPVGTQAVRITHPEYRDFVRFIDVPYGRTLEVPVGLTQYRAVQHDIQGRPINSDRINYVDPPWYRRWYVYGGAAVGLAIIGGIIAGTIVRNDSLPEGPCRVVGGGGC